MRPPRRGQVFRLKSDPVGKPRPILVVSIDSLNGGIYLTAVPFYGDEDGRRRHLKSCAFFSQGEYGLEKDCVAKADEISMMRKSELRLSDGPMTELDTDGMRRVTEAIAYCLGINT